jgi:hypothetical protein
MLSPPKDQARDNGNDYGEDDFDRGHRRPRIRGLMSYHDQTDRDPKKRSSDDRLQPTAVTHGGNGTAFQNSRKYRKRFQGRKKGAVLFSFMRTGLTSARAYGGRVSRQIR